MHIQSQFHFGFICKICIRCIIYKNGISGEDILYIWSLLWKMEAVVECAVTRRTELWEIWIQENKDWDRLNTMSYALNTKYGSKKIRIETTSACASTLITCFNEKYGSKKIRIETISFFSVTLLSFFSWEIWIQENKDWDWLGDAFIEEAEMHEKYGSKKIRIEIRNKCF